MLRTWTADSKDLLCPLCGYNLRGLSEPRCPECGFKFTWRELIDAEKNRHLYLFEHGKGRNFVTLWKTYWRTCWPRRFWSDLHPAQPVHVVRLLIYWIIVSSVLTCGLVAKFVSVVVEDAKFVMRIRASSPPRYQNAAGVLVSFTPAEMKRRWPLPWEWRFWRYEFSNVGNFSYYNSPPLGYGYGGLLLCWPWLTLTVMLVFRRSMRQARIRLVHLLRTVVYACDFGLLLVIGFFGVCFAGRSLPDGWYLLLGALLCCAITTYRLHIAFSKYLRVHLPLATVVASQVIAFLFVFLVLCWVDADLSRPT